MGTVNCHQIRRKSAAGEGSNGSYYGAGGRGRLLRQIVFLGVQKVSIIMSLILFTYIYIPYLGLVRWVHRHGFMPFPDCILYFWSKIVRKDFEWIWALIILKMGNNPPHGIPKMILKNWTPINEAPNTYKNKLTGQLAHKHIVVVDEPQQI